MGSDILKMTFLERVDCIGDGVNSKSPGVSWISPGMIPTRSWIDGWESCEHDDVIWKKSLTSVSERRKLAGAKPTHPRRQCGRR